MAHLSSGEASGHFRFGPAALAAWLVLSVMTGGELLAVLAFPGAEGAGAYATGGRSGDVYHVTNLNDSGPGSLRYGVQNALGARTIVFDVSGMISLDSTLLIHKPHITIAGQTAPGLGICIKNYDVNIASTHDVIVRHIRVRPGLAAAGTLSGMYDADSLTIGNSQNVILDHCSASWSIDECMSAANGNTNNITLQWCYITEGLFDTHDHPYGTTQTHSDGTLVACEDASGFITMHHNLWAHQNLRMPRVRSYNFYTATGDVRNNVMYDWGHTAAYGGGDTATHGTTAPAYDDRSFWNFCGNYAIAGPSTSSSHINYALEDWGQGIDPAGVLSTWDMKAYQSGNKIDSDRDHVLDGVDTGWGMTSGPMIRMSSPFYMPGIPVTMDSPDVAYQRILAGAGAIPWNRDSVDARVTNEVITQTGRIIDSQKDPNDPLADPNGYPIIPVIHRAAGWDADQDGMPNSWETWYGTDPAAADNSGSLVSDGYTNLEKYLTWITNNDLVYHPGDVNGDNAVNLIDLGTLAINWGTTGKAWRQGNFDETGTVDLTDLALLASQWGWSGPSPSPAPVPEPVTVSLLALSSLAVLRHRK